MEQQLEFWRDVLAIKGLTRQRYSATLGKSSPVCEGEEGPDWANPNFSYRFTGQPPVEVYEANGFFELEQGR